MAGMGGVPRVTGVDRHEKEAERVFPPRVFPVPTSAGGMLVCQAGVTLTKPERTLVSG